MARTRRGMESEEDMEWDAELAVLAPFSGSGSRAGSQRRSNLKVSIEDIPTWTEYYMENKAIVDKRRVHDSFYASPDAFANRKLSLWKGDITKLGVDAIVNAANDSLLGGGGVDGAIHAAAGRGLYDECRQLRGCLPGRAKITGGHNLPAKHVIHTVGPLDGDEATLVSCYKQSLRLMLEKRLRSIAFPCIATGIYGFPNRDAARAAVRVVREFLEDHGHRVDRVVFCVFLPQDEEWYHDFMRMFFPMPMRSLA